MNTATDANAPISPKTHNLTFTGNGAEYFGIWIVNLLLSIITLGIYSAWAKVRTQRYFYGNTHLAGSTFDYLANPITILKGRLIAVGLLAIYMSIDSILPGGSVIFILLLGLLTPWLVVRAYAFNAQNSAYRNIRFNFIGTISEAIKQYLFFPVLTVFTLGLLFPYVRYRQTQFTVENHLFGKQAFGFSAKPGDYYRVFMVVFFISIVFFFLMMSAMSSLISASGETPDSESASTFLAISLLMYVPLGLLGVYIQVKLLNLLYNNLNLSSDITFTANYTFGKMLWLHISNLLGIIFTLGLFYPWAKVRMAKYKAEQLSLTTQTDLNSFTGLATSNKSATGDEIGEIFAIDLGF
jgi:uncharacterized membrane protein YjgN (DUF898 family)